MKKTIMKNVLIPIIFVTWVFTLGIHVYSREGAFSFETQDIITSVPVELKIQGSVYSRDTSFKDKQYYYGIPYVFSYSGVRFISPSSLELRIFMDEDYEGAQIIIESASLLYENQEKFDLIETNQPVKSLIQKEIVKTYPPRTHYLSKIIFPKSIYKAKDFEVAYSGYILFEGQKINFSFKHEAHQLKSREIVPGWLLLFVALSGGA